MSDHTQDTSAIEQDIGRTRARLDARLDELTQRFSPGQLLDEALDYVRNGQATDFTRNLAANIREKPLPVLLTGIGLAWLMATGPGAVGATRRYTVPEGTDYTDYNDLVLRARTAGDTVARTEGETDEAWNLRVHEARGKVLGVTRSAQETVSAFGERIEQAITSLQEQISAGIDSVRARAHDARDALGDRVSQARDMASGGLAQGRDALGALGAQGRQLGQAVSDRLGTGSGSQYSGQYMGYQSGQRMRDTLLSSLGDHPLVLGALGVAAGAVLGALLPRTELEEQYLGETERNLRSAAQGAVQQAMESGRNIAQAVMQEGRSALNEAASDGGLGGQSLRDLGAKAQTVGERVLHAGQQAAQKEGLIQGEEGMSQSAGGQSAGGQSADQGRGGDMDRPSRGETAGNREPGTGGPQGSVEGGHFNGPQFGSSTPFGTAEPGGGQSGQTGQPGWQADRNPNRPGGMG